MACHLARNPRVEFILTDRSFRSINDIVQQCYGKYLGTLFTVFTCGKWKFESSEKYIYANCYKVIGCDPKDEIIPETCSLKVGVS